VSEFWNQKKRRLHGGGVGPEMRSPAWLEKKRLHEGGVGPRILSSAGLTVRIIVKSIGLVKFFFMAEPNGEGCT